MPEVWLRPNLRPILPFTAVKFAVCVFFTYVFVGAGWPGMLCMSLLWLIFFSMLFLQLRFGALLSYWDGRLSVSRGQKGRAYVPIEY
ncbi:MAG TPA: hypothetical protein VHV77_07275, partial [Pirellulales bacterium]|nr:hypothetical protein [Pirellulales bacterium]